MASRTVSEPRAAAPTAPLELWKKDLHDGVARQPPSSVQGQGGGGGVRQLERQKTLKTENVSKVSTARRLSRETERWLLTRTAAASDGTEQRLAAAFVSDIQGSWARISSQAGPPLVEQRKLSSSGLRME